MLKSSISLFPASSNRWLFSRMTRAYISWWFSSCPGHLWERETVCGKPHVRICAHWKKLLWHTGAMLRLGDVWVNKEGKLTCIDWPVFCIRQWIRASRGAWYSFVHKSFFFFFLKSAICTVFEDWLFPVGRASWWWPPLVFWVLFWISHRFH